MWMILFTLDDPDRLDEVLRAWEALGVSGVTILESTGIRRYQQLQQIPARYAPGFLPRRREEGHYTLFSMVPDEARAQACLAAVEALLGDLNEPDTGVFAAWPLAFTKGVPAEGGQT